MARAQIKIFVAVVALIVLSGTVLGAYWAWEKIFKPEADARRDLKETLGTQGAKSDPGRSVHGQAMDLIRAGEMEAAKEKLKQVIRIYRDSERYEDSRRVLGEMNMDRLFSRSPMPGKLEFTVNREPGLDFIARKNRSTIPFLRRINNLGRTIIHPGDRLVIYPLDFEIEVRVSENRLTLTQRGDFFKDYRILEFNLAPGTKLPPTTNIASKPAYVGDKPVRDSDDRYPQSRKWLQTTSHQRPGVIFCAAPKKKDDGTPNGIYLDEADIEELTTVIRVGIPVKFSK